MIYYMEIKDVTGIVITELPYSESSKILNIITREYGVIGVMAKGAAKLKSKLRAGASKLTYAKFEIYYNDKGLSNLTGIDIIDNLKNINANICRLLVYMFNNSNL